MALRPVQASLLGGTLASVLFRAAEDLLPGAFEAPPSLGPPSASALPWAFSSVRSSIFSICFGFGGGLLFASARPAGPSLPGPLIA